ncbi:MAG: hypothetical protein QM756_00345 [Polyangiaceae bacterium]
MRATAAALLVCLLSACAAAPPPAPAAPPPAPQPEAAPPPAPKAAQVPPAPSACAAFLEAPMGCDESRTLAERLADALGENEALTRDHKLACVEAGAGPSAGMLRALRADLAPVACADALATPLLEAAQPPSPELEKVLLGLMLSGRLSRLAASPPTLAEPYDKARFLEFFEKSLKPWMLSEALAIGELSSQAAKLSGYGKAIAALESGLADLRFVQAARKVALPTELASDADARNVYYAALDEALEPRKARGRDAALVGLRLFAELGVLKNQRLTRARQLLGELYGGSRVDALDGLLLPELPPLRTDSVEHKLAARLPTFYALEFLSTLKEAADPKLLRAFAERGLPTTLRTRLDGEKLGAEARYMYALLEAQRGLVYFSATAFAHSAQIASQAPNDAGCQLLLGIGRALEAAPKDAAALMLGSPRPSGPLGSLDALNALAQKKQQRYAAEAEFDAASVAALSPPEGDAKFWRELAARYERAEKGLRDKDARARAHELGDAAKKTAEAVARTPSPAPAPAKPAQTPP